MKDGSIVVQRLCDHAAVPEAGDFVEWARATRDACDGGGALTIRIVDEAEMTTLNETFRDARGPTNVLSFPADNAGLPPEHEDLLGDIAICAPVVAREARAQHKSERSHWAHLVVHGVLHLLGYDHQSAGEAREMEELEINLLRRFGISDPYAARTP